MDERLESLQTGQIDCYATGICRADVVGGGATSEWERRG